VQLADLLPERRRPRPAPQAEAEPAADGAQELRSEPRILALLERVLEHKTLLTVAVQGLDELYTSMVLEVVPEAGYLVLDELRPRDGHDALHPGRVLHVSCRLGCVSLAFSSAAQRIASAEDGAYYQVPLPDRMRYFQKRGAHRAPVPVSDARPVLFVLEDGRSLAGELRDLSVGGFSARLNPGAPHRLSEGDYIGRCLVHLDGERTIETPVTVCHLDDRQRSRRPRMGLRFAGLGPQQLRAVEAAVAALERRQLRRLPQR